MIILHSNASLRKWITSARRKARPIAFVPTMGALHQGHLNLMRKARQLVGTKGCVVVSIFVNPTQFNQKSDLKKYPRQPARDALLCKKVGVNLVFAPTATSLYPPDFSTWVEETKLALPLCGATRPGHFRGVCTIVAKLFNLVQPDIAIFGQKDAQQAAVIQRMVRDLNFPIRIVVAPIVREPDGLAMSSRNQRLAPKQRALAPQLHQILNAVRSECSKGNRSALVLSRKIKENLQKIPDLRIDYVAFVHPTSLTKVPRVRKGTLLAIAVFLGKVRLIDNIRL